MSKTDITGRRWPLVRDGHWATLILSEGELALADLDDGTLAGEIDVQILEASAPIPDQAIAGSRVAILEVRPAEDASLNRLLRLRQDHPDLRVVAAVRDGSIAVAKALLRAGVHDLVSLPLSTRELRATLAEIRHELEASAGKASTGHVVSVVRSIGGVGATTLATQLAVLQAEQDSASGREVGLLDLDLQFGNAATYLGLSGTLTIADLIDAGRRVDGAMLRAAAIDGPNRVKVFAAPNDIVPLESVQTDQVFHILDLACREFGTVYVDLPGAWTSWSLSVAGRSNLIVLVIELTIASLRQAKRQLALLADQGLQDVPLLIVANRVQKRLFGTINLKDAESAIGAPVSLAIANDFPLVSAALDQGTPISQVNTRSKVHKDLSSLLGAIKLQLEPR